MYVSEARISSTGAIGSDRRHRPRFLAEANLEARIMDHHVSRDSNILFGDFILFLFHSPINTARTVTTRSAY